MAKKIPLRKCIGCNEMIAKNDMLRVIKTKDNIIKLDPTGRENGRGAYLHFNAECLDKAIKSKGLERSFKMSIGKEIYEKLNEELMVIEQNKALSMIGLATKAGKTQTGEFSTEKAVKEGSACIVLVATDASDNTKKKFRNMCSYYQVTMKEFSDKVSLGNACGKEFRATLAITDAGFAKTIEKHIDSYDNLEVQ